MSRKLLEVAVDAARAAAALVRDRAAAEVTVAATKSSEVDVVTQADRDAELLIRERLATARPDDAVLGEEGDDVAGTTGVRWIVDPIDGTVNFLYGIPAYSVSIAAEADGVVVAGVVLDVAAGHEYLAHRGADGSVEARRNGMPLRVRSVAPLAQRLIATGFSYEAEQRVRQAEALLRLLPRIRDIRRFGSCALDLCRVAEGSVDGYVEEGVNLWDYAAGALVAEGAGARVERLPGVGGRDAVVCAPEDGFDDLRNALAEAGYFASPGQGALRE